MILIDWGTSSFRAFRTSDETVLERRESDRGILRVQPGEFATALQDEVGDWLASGDAQVLMAGMVGSRQGWSEAPYLACPAGSRELAASLLPVAFAGASVRIVPGVQTKDPSGVPEVMRGEETQIVGVLDQLGDEATCCLPGSHSKWVSVRGGRIDGFTTHMTGEAFAALRGHTILGRMMQDGPLSVDAFRRGVRHARQPGGLLHHLFGVRTQGLFGFLPETEAPTYLSGLLIGHEIAAAAPIGVVHLVGAPALCQLYALAPEEFGAHGTITAGDAAPAGLLRIARSATWS